MYTFIYVCVHTIKHRVCKANECLHTGHHKRRSSRIYSVLFHWKDLDFAPLTPQTSTSTPLLALLVKKAKKPSYFVEKKGFKTLSIFKLSYSATNFQRRLQRTPQELQASVPNDENVQLKDKSPGQIQKKHDCSKRKSFSAKISNFFAAKGGLVDTAHLDFCNVFEEFSKPQPKMKNLICINML